MAKPRVKVPKKAKVGDIVEIKSMISHKMETGLRKDKKNRQSGAPQDHQQPCCDICWQGSV